MIVDTHVHICDGGWPPGSEKGLSSHEMLECMDRFGVEKAWISSVTGLVRDFIYNNDLLYEFSRADQDRFVCFFTVNPNYPELVRDEIKRCVEVLGCRGIKMHPWLQAFSVTYDIVNKIVEESIRYKLPILFHDGTPPYSDCLQIANLAELYPEARIILGHSGLYDLYRNAIAAAKRHKNIYLCLCGTSIGDTRQIIKEVDNGKILFGSDFGTANISILQERIKILEYAADDEKQKDRIFYKNAIELI